MEVEMAVDENARAPETPRFSRLLNTVLGSPFLTIADLPRGKGAWREGESEPSQNDLETVDGSFSAVPRAHTITRPTSPTPSFSTDTYSFLNWPEGAEIFNTQFRPSLSDAAPACSFLPASGRRSAMHYHPYPTPGPSPYNTMRYPNMNAMKHSRSFGLLPRLWDAFRESSPGKKGKRRTEEATSSVWNDQDGACVDYANLPPLDGEEGELIDDEACFIDVRVVTGIDIISQIPVELAMYLFTFLDLQAVMSCKLVSRNWNRLATDNSVWRSLFIRNRVDGWDVDLRRVRRSNMTAAARFAWAHSSLTRRRTIPAPLELNWYDLFKTCRELDSRWSGTAFAGNSSEDKENAVALQPTVKRLQGHHDSVYCAEFDSARVITGSRDRSIKVWSLKTGRCLATIKGHRGSVLCLKFEKDWDLDPKNALAEEGLSDWRKGFMVSGSSDHTVCVWDLYTCSNDDEPGRMDTAVTAELRGVLRGHGGGVLDIEINPKWIVSCSKDALIRVWKRDTLEMHRTFDGHEGPVNAVGLQGDRIVSASGDGKLMMWDITTGERLRTFEGHSRGLACVEFKNDIIVSGSNDQKIKVWNASTGECIRTLTGHEDLVRALAFDPRRGRLVSGSYDRTVKVWDLRTGKMVREFKGQYESHIFDVKFDCSRIVSTSHDHSIVIFDFADGLDSSLLV